MNWWRKSSWREPPKPWRAAGPPVLIGKCPCGGDITLTPVQTRSGSSGSCSDLTCQRCGDLRPTELGQAYIQWQHRNDAATESPAVVADRTWIKRAHAIQLEAK